MTSPRSPHSTGTCPECGVPLFLHIGRFCGQAVQAQEALDSFSAPTQSLNRFGEATARLPKFDGEVHVLVFPAR